MATITKTNTMILHKSDKELGIAIENMKPTIIITNIYTKVLADIFMGMPFCK